MHLEKAKNLKIGDKVCCPEDRGQLAFNGIVEQTAGAVDVSHQGIEYVWITVRKPGAYAEVWPSNRLLG